jgi:hypothetical protein
MRQIVKWHGGQIVVRPGTVADDIAARYIAEQVLSTYPRDDNTQVRVMQFGQLCSQTESSEGLDWKPEQVRNLDAAGMRTAYEAFTGLPKTIYGRWFEAYALVDAEMDVDLGPLPLPESAEKKA